MSQETDDRTPPRVAVDLGYSPPTSFDDIGFDIVTPCRNRGDQLVRQATRLAGQLGPYDRWTIIDDGSDLGKGVTDEAIVECVKLIGAMRLTFMHLRYARPEHRETGTVNRARHAGCSLARPGSWIIELDDHDYIRPGALDLVRDAIVRGALFVYGDAITCTTDTLGPETIYRPLHKPDYRPWLLRDMVCPTEGLRAFPKWAYELVGGYRWYGPVEVGGNEYPAGDFGLFLRMEQAFEGKCFYRVPSPLVDLPKIVGSISADMMNEQGSMAVALRIAAQEGRL